MERREPEEHRHIGDDRQPDVIQKVPGLTVSGLIRSERETSASRAPARRRSWHRTSWRRWRAVRESVAQQRSKHGRHAQRKDQHEDQMAVHHLRPIEMSNASMTTSVLSRPATMRKVLPYS